MDKVALVKKLMAIRSMQDHGDIDGLAFLAYDMTKTVFTLSRPRGEADNYRTFAPGIDRSTGKATQFQQCASGSREFCLGVAHVIGPFAIVVCNQMIVWPEERWGEVSAEVPDLGSADGMPSPYVSGR